MHLKIYFYPFSLVAVLLATNLHAQSSHWQPRSPFVIDQQHRNRDSLIALHKIFFKAASSFDFSNTMDSCNQYIQTKDDAMAAIEAKGMDHNPVLGAEWDRLFEQKYFAFQDVISTYSANNASLFADEIQRQLARLDMMVQNIKYEVRILAIQNDTTIRYYEIRAAVDKLWVYNFPANGLENMARVVFVAQLRIIEKKPLKIPSFGDEINHSQPLQRNRAPVNGSQMSIGGGIINRAVEKRPEIPLSEHTGIVVIQVCVNPDGTVSSAQYTMRGSTSQNTELRNIAMNTAKKLVFAPAAKEECGTVNFSFRIH